MPVSSFAVPSSPVHTPAQVVALKDVAHAFTELQRATPSTRREWERAYLAAAARRDAAFGRKSTREATQALLASEALS